MTFKYKNSILGLSCILMSACSTLSDLGLTDLNSIPTGVPEMEDVTGGLDQSRLEGAVSLAKAATLTNEEVMQYAKSFSTIKDGQNEVAGANSPYTIRLNKLVKSHLKEDGLNLNFKVYISPEINAFAMADGTVRVYSGLMDKMKDDELMFVIGHEIGHVKNEHTKSQLQKAYAAHALLSTGANELKAATGNTVGGELGRIGLDKAEGIMKELADAQFSQADETEADDYGLKFIKKHKLAEDAGVRALLKLSEVGEEDQSLVEGLFSSHPDSKERAERIQSQLGKMSISSEASEPGHTHVEKEPAQASVETRARTGSATIIETPETDIKLYAIQVEAATSPEKADETLANFEASGFKGEIQKAMVKGNIYYRVLIGNFKNPAQAKAAIFDIQNTGLSDGQPFVQIIQRIN